MKSNLQNRCALNIFSGYIQWTGYLRLLLASIVLLLLMPAGYAAQQNGDDRSSTPKASRILSHSVLGPRTSPFDPPTADVFVTDGGAGLDTGCTYNTDSNHPLVISVAIDKFVGDVDANGFLVNPAPLITAGIIPATVDIIMPAYDIDVNGSPPPERDQALFNGQSLGFLTGDNNIWKLNSFSIDIRKVKFPSRPALGGNVTPVINKVQINIDTLSSGRWCAAIDWVALVIPVRPKLALELKFIDGNKIRKNTGAATIDVIYQQDFDLKSCSLKTKIGPIDEYPFSGSATSGEAKLRAKLKTCPENSIDPPEIKADWAVDKGGPSGSNTWNGFEGDVTVKMPGKVGSYTVDFSYTVNGKEEPGLDVSRKLFVTKNPPITSDSPRRSWYEKATAWASGESDDSVIIIGVLDGLYVFGGGNWRYGYHFNCIKLFGSCAVDPGPIKCDWEDLVADPIKCNFADCYVFSEVLENMTKTLGVGGLSSVTVLGSSSKGFLTTRSLSLDMSFRGSASPVGSTAAYDRYVFSSHSLRKRDGRYYDATFNGIYGSETQFIAFNKTGKTAFDADGREYLVTDKGARIYDLPGNSYDSWGNHEYALPKAPSPAPKRLMSLAANLQFPNSASYRTLDANSDGIYEGVAVDIDVEVLSAGTYSIAGQLERNGNLVANRPANESQQFSRSSFQASAPGVFKVTLTFSGEQIYQSGQNGPYDLALNGISISGNIRTTLQTPSYDHLSFGETLTTIIGVGDEGADDNHDGKLEGIRANVDANVRAAGSYRLAGSLIKDGTTLVSADTAVNLTAGQKSVALLFPGLPLKRSGQDGPYEGVVSLLDGNSHSVSSFDFLTQPYQANAFASVIEPVGTQSDQGIDSNGNGLYDTLSIKFGMSFSRKGTFLLTGTLGNATGTNSVFSEQLITVVPGIRQVTLNFAGPNIYGQQIDGPYRIEVSLRDPTTQKIVDRLALPQETKGYQYTDFDSTRIVSAISLTGASNDKGIDTDGNGAFNQLQVGVAVKLKDSGTYEWSARLVDSSGTEIGFYTRRAFLSVGNNQIDFVFDGIRIGKNGKDGPYFVKGLLMFGASANLVATDVAATSAYSASEYEGYVAKIPGDINGDGVVNCADIAIVKASFGKKKGQTGFDVRADVNKDSVVDIRDLSYVSKLLPKGSKC